MKIKTSYIVTIGFIAIMCATVAAGIHQDNKRENAVKEEIKKGLGKHTNVEDLGIVDGCHVKHYIIQEDRLEDGEVQHSYDSFYMADCNGTETTTQKVGGKFKSDQAIVKKPKE